MNNVVRHAETISRNRIKRTRLRALLSMAFRKVNAVDEQCSGRRLKRHSSIDNHLKTNSCRGIYRRV
jgi:hypothetical protein